MCVCVCVCLYLSSCLQVPHCPPEHLFIATALPFLAFYALFALVLYPLAPSLQNPDWLTWLPGVLPQGLHGLAAALQHWVYSLFYVVADLWGPVMITLAFWWVKPASCGDKPTVPLKLHLWTQG